MRIEDLCVKKKLLFESEKRDCFQKENKLKFQEENLRRKIRIFYLKETVYFRFLKDEISLFLKI